MPCCPPYHILTVKTNSSTLFQSDCSLQTAFSVSAGSKVAAATMQKASNFQIPHFFLTSFPRVDTVVNLLSPSSYHNDF